MLTPNSIPSEEPLEITAGDTVKWTRNLAPDYDSSWALTYYLNGSLQAQIVATASGSVFSVTVLASESIGYDPGTYSLTGYVSKAGERYPVYSGTLIVKPDPAQLPAGYDARTDARQVADSLLDVIKKRATRDEISYLNGIGVNIQKMTHEELTKAYTFWNGRALGEERLALAKAGKPNGSMIRTRFNRP